MGVVENPTCINYVHGIFEASQWARIVGRKLS